MGSCRNGRALRTDLPYSLLGNDRRYRIDYPAENRIYGRRGGMVSVTQTWTVIVSFHSLQVEGWAFVRHHHPIHCRCRKRQRQHIRRLRRRCRHRHPRLVSG